jgi:hypothetical protein
MLSNQWTVPDFYPIDYDYLPRGVRLPAYARSAPDLPAEPHADMEARRSTAKLVVTI